MYHNPKFRNIANQAASTETSVMVGSAGHQALRRAANEARYELMVETGLRSASAYRRLVARWRQHLIDTSSRRIANWIRYGGI